MLAIIALIDLLARLFPASTSSRASFLHRPPRAPLSCIDLLARLFPASTSSRASFLHRPPRAPLSCIDLLARLFPASTSPLRRFQVDSPQQSYKYIEQYSKALETRANLLHNTGASTKRKKSQHLYLQHSDASQYNTKERETGETC